VAAAPLAEPRAFGVGLQALRLLEFESNVAKNAQRQGVFL
jgi:hypothetical protein